MKSLLIIINAILLAIVAIASFSSTIDYIFIPASVFFIFSLIFLLSKNKINNLIKTSFWINIAVFVIGIIIILINYISLQGCVSAACETEKLVAMDLVLIGGEILIIISLIIFLIGFFMKKN